MHVHQICCWRYLHVCTHMRTICPGARAVGDGAVLHEHREPLGDPPAPRLVAAAARAVRAVVFVRQLCRDLPDAVRGLHPAGVEPVRVLLALAAAAYIYVYVYICTRVCICICICMSICICIWLSKLICIFTCTCTCTCICICIYDRFKIPPY